MSPGHNWMILIMLHEPKTGGDEEDKKAKSVKHVVARNNYAIIHIQNAISCEMNTNFFPWPMPRAVQ